MRQLAARLVEIERSVDEFPTPSAASFRELMGAQRAGSAEVIPVRGVIMPRYTWMTWALDGTGLDRLIGAIAEAAADPEVGTIVLDVASPGGSVEGVPEAAAALRGFQSAKPIIGVANSQAASAAYWLIAQANEVVVTPSGEVGSVGVYSLHLDWSRALDADGITPTLISAGEHKVEGNPYEPLSDEARARIQFEVDHFYSLFRADIRRGRGARLSDDGSGRSLLPQEALKAGLVDRIDTLDAVLHRVGRGRAASRRAEDDQPGIVAEEPTPEPTPGPAAPTPIHPPDPRRLAAFRTAYDQQVQAHRERSLPR